MLLEKTWYSAIIWLRILSQIGGYNSTRVDIIHRVLLRLGAVHSKHWTNFFFEIKPVTSVLVQILKTNFLLNFAANFFVFVCFFIFSTKSIQIKILTSVWSAQHPNAGQNMQQLLLSIQI